ncbi:hypothetical protein BSBH6_01448 [Bacillus subtilis]|nr:hypothetical protein BSBH6_01448 [Bacillus subtilis]RPK17136.1 hypothetical protein BH5_01440 [Bacillus subtilis]
MKFLYNIIYVFLKKETLKKKESRTLFFLCIREYESFT